MFYTRCYVALIIMNELYKELQERMKTVEFKQEDLVNVHELTEQRNNKIEHLVEVLKINDSITERKSSELLQDIFKINSQLKLEEDKLIVKTLTDI